MWVGFIIQILCTCLPPCRTCLPRDSHLPSRQAGAMKPRLWRYLLSMLLACILLSSPQHPRVASALSLPQLLLGKRGTMKAHPQHLLDCMNDAYEPHGTTWASAMGDRPGASVQLHGGLATTFIIAVVCVQGSIRGQLASLGSDEPHRGAATTTVSRAHLSSTFCAAPAHDTDPRVDQGLPLLRFIPPYAHP